MVYEARDEVVEYKGHCRTIKTLGFWCTNCGEGILTGKPLVASEKAYQAFKEEVDELERQAASSIPTLLGPEEIASVRKKLRGKQILDDLA
jgi:YgiT-type zinc finger domain-containing protein